MAEAKKKKEKRTVEQGRIYIKATFNNTIQLPILKATQSHGLVQVYMDLKVQEKVLLLQQEWLQTTP